MDRPAAFATKCNGVTYFPQTKMESVQGQCTTNAQVYLYLGYPHPMCRKAKTQRNRIRHLSGGHSPLSYSWCRPYVVVGSAGPPITRVSQLFHMCSGSYICRMAPHSLMPFSAIGCSVLVAFLWGPKILFSQATPINSLQPPVSWDPWSFTAVTPSYNQTIVASASREDFRHV